MQDPARAGSRESLSFPEALQVLDNAARFGINPQLETMVALADALGRPQDRYASVQVTGTNGKSSTTRMIAALLDAHGRSAGAYTSPELVSMTERLELGGAPVDESEFARGVAAAVEGVERLRSGGRIGRAVVVTQFELLTAAALWLLAEHGVQFACLEVGMGGRWDATSVVSPAVAVVTGVALDHTDHLGMTREAIAADKAHIIKSGSVAVLGPGTEGVETAFLARAEACGARVRAVRAAADGGPNGTDGAPSPVDEADTVRFEVTKRPDRPGGALGLDVLGLHGAYRGLTLRAPSYQAANVATAVAAAEAALGRALDGEDVRGALESLRFPGRFELVRDDPLVVVDAAHNPEAAAVLAQAILEAWPDPSRRPLVLLGILADKDASGIVEALAPVAGGIACTRSGSPRAMDVGALAAVVRRATGVEPLTFATVREAIDSLMTNVGAGLVVSGSVTTAGEAREQLLGA